MLVLCLHQVKNFQVNCQLTQIYTAVRCVYSAQKCLENFMKEPQSTPLLRFPLFQATGNYPQQNSPANTDAGMLRQGPRTGQVVRLPVPLCAVLLR